MMFSQALATIAGAALFVFAPAASGYGTACTYQEYKCGYALVSDNAYNNTELITAVNQTSTVIPPLNANQLLNVLFRCADVRGEIVGNSYCIAGCISMGANTQDDQCAL